MFKGSVFLKNDIIFYVHVVNLWTWNPSTRNDDKIRSFDTRRDHVIELNRSRRFVHHRLGSEDWREPRHLKVVTSPRSPCRTLVIKMPRRPARRSLANHEMTPLTQ